MVDSSDTVLVKETTLEGMNRWYIDSLVKSKQSHGKKWHCISCHLLFSTLIFLFHTTRRNDALRLELFFATLYPSFLSFPRSTYVGKKIQEEKSHLKTTRAL